MPSKDELKRTRQLQAYRQNLEHVTACVDAAKDELAHFQEQVRYWRDEIRKLEALCN